MSNLRDQLLMLSIQFCIFYSILFVKSFGAINSRLPRVSSITIYPTVQQSFIIKFESLSDSVLFYAIDRELA